LVQQQSKTFETATTIYIGISEGHSVVLRNFLMH